MLRSGDYKFALTVKSFCSYYCTWTFLFYAIIIKWFENCLMVFVMFFCCNIITIFFFLVVILLLSLFYAKVVFPSLCIRTFIKFSNSHVLIKYFFCVPHIDTNLIPIFIQFNLFFQIILWDTNLLSSHLSLVSYVSFVSC
jgi:hypothetical protein